MKTYLTLLVGMLLLSGCDKLDFTKPQEYAQFSFEINGDKLLRLNRGNGEIDAYWLEDGKLKCSSNYRPYLTVGGSYEDENGKRIYYVGYGKTSYSVVAAANAIISQREDDPNQKAQYFQLRFIGEAVLRVSEVSGLVMAYVHADGKLEPAPLEIRKMTIGMLLTDEKGKSVVYVGNGILDYSKDKVIEAIMRKYPGLDANREVAKVY